MGCFNSTCAITRMTILRGMHVVLVRVDMSSYPSGGRDWWEPEALRDGVVGMWRGPYNDYGSIDDVPPLPPGTDPYSVSDVLVLAHVWDQIVRRERKLSAKRMAEHADAPWATHPNGLIRLWAESYYHKSRFFTLKDADGNPRHRPLEEVAYETEQGDHTFGVLKSWPTWLPQVGHVFDYCRRARVNFLAASWCRGQHNAVEDIDYLARLTTSARNQMEKRLYDLRH